MPRLCGTVGFLLLALPVVAWSQTFAAISIKTAGTGDSRNMRMRVLPNGDLHATAVPVLALLRYAYDVPVNPSPRLSGLPGWRDTYDIEARAPANAVPASLPEREKRRRIQEMIRRVLVDRFKLVMRVEQKTMSVYALTVARGGPLLQKSTIAEKDCVFDTGIPESCHDFIVGRGHPLNGRAIDMDDLAHYLENWSDLPVVNRTGLHGLFAVETEGWTPMLLPPPPPGKSPPARFDDLPTIFTVLRKTRSRTETATSDRARIHRGAHRAPDRRLRTRTARSWTESGTGIDSPAFFRQDRAASPCRIRIPGV